MSAIVWFTLVNGFIFGEDRMLRDSLHIWKVLWVFFFSLIIITKIAVFIIVVEMGGREHVCDCLVDLSKSICLGWGDANGFIGYLESFACFFVFY